MNRSVLDARREDVVAVLVDPRAYGCFVVGTRELRRWDGGQLSPGRAAVLARDGRRRA